MCKLDDTAVWLWAIFYIVLLALAFYILVDAIQLITLPGGSTQDRLP